jgi:hypothetical protein
MVKEIADETLEAPPFKALTVTWAMVGPLAVKPSTAPSGGSSSTSSEYGKGRRARLRERRPDRCRSRELEPRTGSLMRCRAAHDLAC